MTLINAFQQIVANWVIRTFGEVSMAPNERASRLLEEALELFQSEGGSLDFARRLADEVFSRDHGKAVQEAGGVGLTFLAYCSSKALDAEDVIMTEIHRVLAKSPSHFKNRNDQKMQHGLSMQFDPATLKGPIA